MSAIHQNAPRMRRHKRRINDDGSELAHAVRAFVDQHQDDSSQLLARQADGANGVGPPRGGAANLPPMGGGFGSTGDDTDDVNNNTATTTSTRGPNTRTNSNGSVRTPTSTSNTVTSTRNLYNPTTTATSTSTSAGFIDDLTSFLFGDTSSSTTRSTSTSSSTSSTPSSTSTSSTTRSTSSSSSSSVSVPSPSPSPSPSSSSTDQSQTIAASNQIDLDDTSANTHEPADYSCSSPGFLLVHMPLSSSSLLVASLHLSIPYHLSFCSLYFPDAFRPRYPT